jgi:hypothetical protein
MLMKVHLSFKIRGFMLIKAGFGKNPGNFKKPMGAFTKYVRFWGGGQRFVTNLCKNIGPISNLSLIERLMRAHVRLTVRLT